MRIAPTCSLLMLASLCIANCSRARAELVTASHKKLPSTSGGFVSGAGMAVDPPAPNPFDNRESQTFLALVSGSVSRVSFVAHAYSGTTAPLRVDITTVVGGQPAASLGHALVPVEEFPGPFIDDSVLNINVDFSAASTMLNAGTLYSIVFSSEIPNANYGLYGVYESNLAAANRYTSGSRGFSQNGSPFASSASDLYFEVTVTPVPEPSTWMLASLGCMLAVFYVRKRSRP